MVCMPMVLLRFIVEYAEVSERYILIGNILF